jgi:hypothetical protein
VFTTDAGNGSWLTAFGGALRLAAIQKDVPHRAMENVFVTASVCLSKFYQRRQRNPARPARAPNNRSVNVDGSGIGVNSKSAELSFVSEMAQWRDPIVTPFPVKFSMLSIDLRDGVRCQGGSREIVGFRKNRLACVSAASYHLRWCGWLHKRGTGAQRKRGLYYENGMHGDGMG